MFPSDLGSLTDVLLQSSANPLCTGQPDASLHTHVSVNTDLVFTAYQHTADTPADVTFNLRDFRVMLAWCLAMNMEIAIRFQSPGAPLLVEPHCPHAVRFPATLDTRLTATFPILLSLALRSTRNLRAVL